MVRLSNIHTFENGQLKQMLVDGGYIPMDDWSGTYRFYVKDHLGNNRMVVHQSGTIEQVNNYYPYGGLMANTTGWNTQRYKYNGKEFDRMHGLDWYDYGARWMDASIGRWHSMDPLCENKPWLSPYLFCSGNPIIRIDPDGMEDYYVNSNGDFYEDTSIWQTIFQFFGWAEKTDRIFAEGADEPMAEFAKGTIKNLNNDNGSTTFEVDNQNDANTIFNCLTNLDDVGCSVEWGKFDHEKNGKISSLFITDHKNREIDVRSKLNSFEQNGESVTFTHNHSLLNWNDFPENLVCIGMDQISNPSVDGDLPIARIYPKTTFILKDQVYKNYKYYNGYGVQKTRPYKSNGD